MSPEEFDDRLQILMAATRAIVHLPLEDMAAYVEVVEELGAEAGDVWTVERQETASYAARLVAAATHLRVTTVMGGVS